MLFLENVSFLGFICHEQFVTPGFLRQPLETVVSLLLRLEGQEIIKRRIHSNLATHPQEGTTSPHGWAGEQGAQSHTGSVTAVKK